MVNGGAQGFISSLNLRPKMQFFGAKCEKWDAQKSVKYIPAAHINHSRAFCSRGGASALLHFSLLYQCVDSN
jgi:hypothetical protein